MEYTVLLQTIILPAGLALVGWLAGKGKGRAEVKKLQAETELLYSEKYSKDLEATKSFREMLVSENESLIKEIREMKLRYEVTTSSLKTQINDLTIQLNLIITDREYNRCKVTSCETDIWCYGKLVCRKRIFKYC